jgi:hypothetical protein
MGSLGRPVEIDMSLAFSFVTQKMDKGYRFIARQYGVVVWAPDVASGIKELETRVDSVATQLREAGFDLNEIELESSQPAASVSLWPQLLPFSIKAVVVAVLAAAILIPVANVFSRTFGPASPLGSAMSHPAQFLTRMADQSDQVPPQTIDEMKQSIRKIFAKIKPVVAEVRTQLSAEDNANPPAQAGSSPPANR